ncbi:Hypothetical predicted protein [Olea europaea subsp. europaea]|uniref:Uncharacterized protein n=1 Tax=Olea europaea subsp. europaea TaxID=158383 RepID=A0A8S0UXE3_OLEEU|nr:Hypothetical predicted protein [Olea europaea subsp. europaea]
MTPDIPRIREREAKQEEAGESESQRETELGRKVERESSAPMALPSIGGDKAIDSQQDEVERLLRAQRSNEAVLLQWSSPHRCLILIF